ncbi:MAG: polysaccharide biosynthesis protein [Lysobacteraceae bacterium]
MIKTRQLFRNHAPRLLVVLHDLAMVWLCWVGLNLLRFSYQPDPPAFPFFSLEILTVLVLQGLVFWRVGLYKGLWRFASLPDLANILKATVLGAVAIGMALFLFFDRAFLVPRAVLLAYPLGLMVLLGAPRLLYRAWKDADHGGHRNGEPGMRVLILGAGRAGEALVRDLNRDARYMPIGFLDDDPFLRGSRIHGVPVLGNLDDVIRIGHETASQMLIIAMPSVGSEQMHRVLTLCEQSKLPFRSVPRIQDVLDGRVLPGELQEVPIEDLLGRKPVSGDWQRMGNWLEGRSVLVTGAGGSIGGELCRKCARLGVRRLVLVELSELALCNISQDLRRSFPSLELVPMLGNCGDAALMKYALAQDSVDAVFHAAAYKQVPLLETEVREAMLNNVLATEVAARCAVEAGVGTFVLISTDKAVDPVNVLGATKRLAEMVCHTLSESSDTRFVTVRFGNVLDSAGSVVPLFRDQIRAGGPVTVTHPEVTRYFMTIPEACQLIMEASAMGMKESIFTLDMGTPVQIKTLAEQMIRVAGKQPGRDIHIVYTGLRPGEKLHEALFHPEEKYQPTSHPKVLEAVPREVNSATVVSSLKLARDAVARYDLARIAQILRTSVPEYRPGPVDRGRTESADVLHLKGS